MSQHTLTLGGVSLGAAGLAAGTASLHKFPGFDIRVSHATGGWIISVHVSYSIGYATEPDLYVIHEDQDLGTELGKIITMHCLQKENK